MNRTSVEYIPAYDRKEELIPLYREYEELLLKAEPTFFRSLEQQNYAEEIERLAEKYGMPKGRIYLLYVEDQLAGCVGMKQSDTDHAELKRLYVRPEFRGRNLGEQMTRKIMQEAKKAGYSYLRLDTIPSLATALRLYRRMGFQEVEPYYDCLIPGTVFLEIKL